jgi:hypothetical protein
MGQKHSNGGKERLASLQKKARIRAGMSGNNSNPCSALCSTLDTLGYMDGDTLLLPGLLSLR